VTATTTEHRRIRVRLDGRPHPGEEFLLPEQTPGVPAAVAEAEAAVRSSMPRLAEAGAALKHAASEARAAPRLDQARDAAAVAADKPMPKDRLTDAARAAVVAAQRRYDAEASLLAERQQVYGQAIVENHAEWSKHQDEIVSTAEAEALALLDQLGRAVDQLTAARSVRDALAEFPVHGGVLSAWRVWKLPALLAERQRVQAEAELDRADSQGGDSTLRVERTVIALLTALRAEVRGRVPKRSAASADAS
jgi:hypothetical protein